MFLTCWYALFYVLIVWPVLCIFPQLQIQNLEHEIQEKRKQMRVLEQRIVESGEASIANSSLVDMQQVIHFFSSWFINGAISFHKCV